MHPCDLFPFRQYNFSLCPSPGDYTPDLRALLAADLIICTPEKWDGISRNWQTRSYVKKVGAGKVRGRCGVWDDMSDVGDVRCGSEPGST